MLSDVNGRHAIILITDGFDENSTIDVAGAVDAVRKAQATLYTVALGGVTGVSLTGEATLRRLADASGGRSFFPWRDSDLDAVAQTIVEDAHSRYLLSYTSSNQNKDGAWRRITVKVPDGYSVRARDGYRAPVPPPIRPVLEFRATDAEQRQVTLSATDIDVIEDGVPQTIDTFQEAIDPVSVVLLLDASGSMVKSADAVRATARQFVAALRPEDSLAVATFADRVKFGHMLGVNRASSAAAIDAYQAAGGTALYDGISEALDVLKAVPGRRAVVVLTDGRDENNAGTAPGSVRTEQDVLAMARQVGAAIFTIGLGSRVAEASLRRLAHVAGGETYSAADAARLDAQFRAVIENLRQRYALSYTSTNTKHDGAWRHVDIRPRRNGLVFAGAGGYFGPER
jgi:VWFA-related protein